MLLLPPDQTITVRPLKIIQSHQSVYNVAVRLLSEVSSLELFLPCVLIIIYQCSKYVILELGQALKHFGPAPLYPQAICMELAQTGSSSWWPKVTMRLLQRLVAQGPIPQNTLFVLNFPLGMFPVHIWMAGTSRVGALPATEVAVPIRMAVFSIGVLGWGHGVFVSS